MDRSNSTSSNTSNTSKAVGQAASFGASLVLSSSGIAPAGAPSEAEPAGATGGGSVVVSGPPLSNTGDKLTRLPLGGITVLVDWWKSTHPIEHLPSLRDLLDVLLGESQERGYGDSFFPDGKYAWPSGAFLAWCDKTRRCLLSINGESLRAIGADKWRSLLDTLVNDGQGKCTRVDLAADFPRDRFDLATVRAAAEVGNFHGFRACEARQPMKRKAGKMVAEGDSVTFGRRGKDGKGAYIRFYDKTLESDGEIDAIRYEVEYSGDLAGGSRGDDGLMVMGVGEILAHCETDAEFVRTIGRLLAGAIDFRQRGNEKNLDRMPRLSWWENTLQVLTETGEKLKLAVLRYKPTIARKMRFLVKQASPTLAYAGVICESIGYKLEEFLLALAEHGERSIPWKKPHKLDATYDPTVLLPGLGRFKTERNLAL